MRYIVTCLGETHDGLFETHRVRATRQTFTQEEAEHYASTIDQSREPYIERVPPFTLASAGTDHFKLSIDAEPLNVVQGKETDDD